MTAHISQQDLDAALERYERDIRARGLAEATITAYVYRAGRFIDWCRDNAVAPLTVDELGMEAARYEAHLGSAYPATKTAWTFTDGERRFVKWLRGGYHGLERSPAPAPRVVVRRGDSPPSVDPVSLLAARRRYREIEPRDLFYRAATDLVGRAWAGSDAPVTLGEALAVLLFTWNRAFYQYHPASNDHVALVEALVEDHRPALSRWRGTRLGPRTIGESRDIAATFATFEQLLGPVGAAKGLHLLAPTFFPIWDRKIASAYGCGLGNRGTNAPRYLRFMELTAQQCGELELTGDAPSDVLKALDEWNYVTFTRPSG